MSDGDAGAASGAAIVLLLILLSISRTVPALIGVPLSQLVYRGRRHRKKKFPLEETPAETSEVQSFHFPDFGDDGGASAAVASSGAMPGQSCLRVEYGRTEILREEAEKWQSGITFVLPQQHADLVMVRVDGQPVARGELVEVDGKLAVRVVELVSNSERESQTQRRSA